MTTKVVEILSAHPQHTASVDVQLLAECLEACGACAQACTACADACLSEERTTELVENVRAMLDCADLCSSTSRVLARLGGSRMTVAVAALQACAVACRACQATCAQVADAAPAPGGHAAACQTVCERCADACERLLASMPAR